jgi:hypothetical protein
MVISGFPEFVRELPYCLEWPRTQDAGPMTDAPYLSNALDRDHPLSTR